MWVRSRSRARRPCGLRGGRARGPSRPRRGSRRPDIARASSPWSATRRSPIASSRQSLPIVWCGSTPGRAPLCLIRWGAEQGPGGRVHDTASSGSCPFAGRNPPRTGRLARDDATESLSSAGGRGTNLLLRSHRPTTHSGRGRAGGRTAVEHFVTHAVEQYGYAAIFLLMLLGSACIPIPSEVVLLF